MAGKITIKIIFTLFSGIISIFDIKSGSVPRMAFIAAFPVFFVLMFLLYEEFQITESLAGMGTGFSIFLLVYFISGKRLGLADVWYSAFTGMVLGSWWWYRAIICACIAGFILILKIRRKQIPFIPCIAMGSIIMNFLRG